MKWYFALSGQTLDDPKYVDMAKASVASARRNTTLQPHLVFSGTDCTFTQEMRRAGVNVILHESRYKDLIYSTWEDPGLRRIASGAMLRLDVPILEQQDDFVLYTDCDTLFLTEPRVGAYQPEIFSVAPEFDIGDYENMNSGVMVMNIARMRQDYDAIMAFSRDNLDVLRQTFDQSVLRAFYAGRWDFLPPTMNWKPYWGPAQSAEIVHFHGPKPFHIRAINSGAGDTLPSILRDLVGRDPTTSSSMADLYYEYLDIEWPALIA